MKTTILHILQNWGIFGISCVTLGPLSHNATFVYYLLERYQNVYIIKVNFNAGDHARLGTTLHNSKISWSCWYAFSLLMPLTKNVFQLWIENKQRTRAFAHLEVSQIVAVRSGHCVIDRHAMRLNADTNDIYTTYGVDEEMEVTTTKFFFHFERKNPIRSIAWLNWENRYKITYKRSKC